MHKLITQWYQQKCHPVLAAFIPLSWLFLLIISLRRFYYRLHFFKKCKFSVPIIVVGNITVGGTGKTPMVIELANLLKLHHYRPGIISRGVGGRSFNFPHQVAPHDQPDIVGDEAILIFEKTNCPVIINKNRVKAVEYLLAQTNCNIILADDGLQHYALPRDIEIILVDAMRKFGNQQLLPAGPLREPLTRLQQADFVVQNGGTGDYTMQIKLANFIPLKNKNQTFSLETKKFHAVAAIGNPQRFFDSLTAAGFEINPHVFPDHYLYQAKDFLFKEPLPIVLTEKDAVKCKNFCDDSFWMASTKTILSQKFIRDFLQKLKIVEKKYVENSKQLNFN